MIIEQLARDRLKPINTRQLFRENSCQILVGFLINKLMDQTTEDIIKAYFEGGNARNIGTPNVVKNIMIAIAEAVKEINKSAEN